MTVPALAAEKAKLRKSFGRRDIFFFLVCTLVGVDGLGALTTKGGAAFTWMIGSVVLFAIPSALLLTELGTTYTDEGGPCVWVRLAFGRLPAAVNNFMYWVSNPVWLGGTLVGSDRAMAISCLDGAGPRGLGGFSARFGTPVRVNLLSGLVATGVFVATELITSGNVYKFFSVALSLAISTTLMSYLGIFPAAWALRHRRPQDSRPFRAPFLRVATIVTLVLVVFATIEALAPGLGGGWFDPQNLPGPQWQPSERWTYLAAAGAPLILFLLAGVAFWLAGSNDRVFVRDDHDHERLMHL